MEPNDKNLGELNSDETQVEITKTSSVVITQTPTSAKRSAFKNVIRQLTDEELKSPAVQKLILDELEQAETDRDEMKVYMHRYHEADKRACILEEKLKTNTTIEVAFGVGMGVGGTLIGLAPSLSQLTETYRMLIAGSGVILVIGAIAVKMIKR